MSDPDECLYLYSMEKIETTDDYDALSSGSASESPMLAEMESARYFKYEDNIILNYQNLDGESYKYNDPSLWSQFEVAMWMQTMAEKYDPSYLKTEEFSKFNGKQMKEMSLSMYEDCDPIYGAAIFREFRDVLYQYDEFSYCDSFEHEQLPSIRSILNTEPIDPSDHFDSISIDSDQPSPQSPPSPSPSEVLPARAQPKKRKGKLWEFIINLLLNKNYNPDIIKWEDRAKGVFRIVKSDKVAQLWGSNKQNSRMTYEKMSRALRYYYRQNILARVDGKRLVYKFCDKSMGWQT